MERKNMWEGYSEAELKELEAVNARYRECLDVAKTERECVKLTRRLAEEQGYQNLKTFIENGTSLKAGDKVYAECMGKTIVLFQIGKEPMEKGMNILGAHVDSPRLDVKQNPLYEDSQLAYLDTHYYGGIKKYQWVTIPLALHGVFAKKDGTVQEVIESKCESTKIVAEFENAESMEDFRKKLTNENLSEFEYQKGSNVIGEYKNYTLESVFYVENAGKLEAVFLIRALSNVEIRLAAVERGQEAQDAAIEDLATMAAGGE